MKNGENPHFLYISQNKRVIYSKIQALSFLLAGIALSYTILQAEPLKPEFILHTPIILELFFVLLCGLVFVFVVLSPKKLLNKLYYNGFFLSLLGLGFIFIYGSTIFVEQLVVTTPGGTVDFIKEIIKIAGIAALIGGIVKFMKERNRVDKALRVSEEKYRALAENIPDIIIRFDQKGRHLLVSPSAAQVVHVEPSQFIGKTHRELGFAEDMCAFWEDTLDAAFKQGQLLEKEFEFEGINGPVFFNWRLVPEFDRSGNVKTVLSISRDITERKHAEKVLREQQELQHLLMQLATNFINVSLEKVDTSINKMLEDVGKFSQVDRVYIFNYDYTRQITTNTHEWCAEGITPELENLQATPFELFQDILESHQRGEIVHIPSVAEMPADHHMRNVFEPQGIKSLILLPLFFEGTNMGFVGFDTVREIRNFTETDIGLLKVLAEIISNVLSRQRADENLRKSMVQFKASFQGSNAAITLCAMENNSFIDCNNRALKLFGLGSKEEFIKKHPSEYSPAYQPDGQLSDKHARELVIKTLKSDDSQTFEWLHQRKDGSLFFTEVTLTKYKLGNDTILQSNIRDITERKQAEQKLADYTQELEQLYHQLDSELDKARQVHERTLPTALPDVEGISFAAHYQPAQKMGGDFYNVIHDGNKIIFYLSDVSGHGLDGAMLSVFIKQAIDSFVNLKPVDIAPHKILQHLSRQFSRENYPEELYFCIFMSVLDLDTLELSYCGAGFQQELLLRLGSGEALQLATKGMFITSYLSTEMLTLKDDSVYITPGTTLFLTSDGLTEQGSKGSYYRDRLPDVFYENAHLPASLVARAIVDDFRQFNNGSLQGKDDITFLVLQVKGK